MKILWIELENLNSLKGSWRIDFEHPDYKKNHELFVISGPTGAGKTTILDAITLALYGRTPRQESLAGSNEIMTRHTGSCMARVCYRCGAGRFISEFFQKKARAKSDGSLQGAECRLVDAESGLVIYTGKSKGFAAATEKVIKLSYKQFCASIMLAQGEFDRFLNGDGKDVDRERDRAAILAKITGTERFKRIGCRVGERASEAQRVFKDAEARYKSQCQDLLDESQLQALKDEQARLEERLLQNGAAMKEVNEGLAWLKQLSELEAGLDAAKKGRADYEAERRGFGDGELVLNRIERAMACKAEYVSLSTVRESQRKDRAALELARRTLADLERPLADAVAKVKEAEVRLAGREEEFAAAKPLWEQVRQLDGRLKLAAQSERNALAKKEEDERRLSKAYEDREALEASLKDLRSKLAGLDAYLVANSGDEKLPSIISSLSALGDTCLGVFDNLDRQKNDLGQVKGDLDRLLARKQADEAALAQADGQLRKLISSEYESVARIIRDGLEADKPCPVCGSLEHPLCRQTPTAAPDVRQSSLDGNGAGARRLGEDILALSKWCDDARKSLQEAERLAAEQGQKLELYENRMAELSKELGDGLAKFSTMLKDCALEDSAVNAAGSRAAFKSALAAVLSSLMARDRLFQDRQAQKGLVEKALEGKKSAFEAIDVESFRTACEESKKIHLQEVQNVAMLDAERHKLFGGRDVAEEEAALSRAVQGLHKEKDAASKMLTDLQNRKAALEGEVVQLEKGLAEADVQAKDAETAFTSALERSGIVGEEEYALFMRDEGRLDLLRGKAEALKEKDTRTRTTLDSCSKALDDCRALHRTDSSLEELEGQKAALVAQAAADQVQKGRNEQVLAQNEKNRGLAEKLGAAYEEARKENEKWQDMVEFVGKHDGSDLEVFVQSLAFQQLLAKANRYLFDISGRYRLVQVPGRVDFKVHDVNFPVDRDDRPVSNMSGGERFIISLSLALGIAELASLSVRVDSLFLDEGFGSLSGKPLTQAVDALKQLQRSGKMLGIITHVDAVIREFDQKIEVLPLAGGFSELRGSGISRQYSQSSSPRPVPSGMVQGELFS